MIRPHYTLFALATPVGRAMPPTEYPRKIPELQLNCVIAQKKGIDSAENSWPVKYSVNFPLSYSERRNGLGSFMLHHEK